ncbi:hypothetical protein [Micromonospora sp. NPDC049497]|uniref:hypothetical protein n=1 Tax=Micromonospora sp. NPDC049497 TaxID=3364273 RepID=UPI0037A00459
MLRRLLDVLRTEAEPVAELAPWPGLTGIEALVVRDTSRPDRIGHGWWACRNERVGPHGGTLRMIALRQRLPGARRQDSGGAGRDGAGVATRLVRPQW